MKLSVRFLGADWKVVLVQWLMLFASLMWYAISHHYEDLGLFAIAIGLASLGVCSRGVFMVRKWQEWRASVSREKK